MTKSFLCELASYLSEIHKTEQAARAWSIGVLIEIRNPLLQHSITPLGLCRWTQHQTQDRRCNQCAAKNGKGETVAVCNVKQKSEERRSKSGNHLRDQQAQDAHSTEGAPTEIIRPQDFRQNHVAAETDAV